MTTTKISELPGLAQVSNDDVFIVNDSNSATKSVTFGNLVASLPEFDNSALDNVDLDGATDGQVLTWNDIDGKWEPADNTSLVGINTTFYDIQAEGNTAYRFNGDGLNGAEDNPTIYLVKGRTYRFTSTLNAHPFRIRFKGGADLGSNDGLSGVDQDVAGDGQGVTYGYIEYTVPMDAPQELEYYCSSHGAMVGDIVTNGRDFEVINVDSGESVPPLTISQSSIHFSGRIDAQSNGQASIVVDGPGKSIWSFNSVANTGTLWELGAGAGNNNLTLTGQIELASSNVGASYTYLNNQNLIADDVSFTIGNNSGPVNILTTSGSDAVNINTATVSQTGEITAAKFIGDGSLLTNLPGEGAVSTVNGEQGHVSLGLMDLVDVDGAPSDGESLIYSGASGKFQPSRYALPTFSIRDANDYSDVTISDGDILSWSAADNKFVPGPGGTGPVVELEFDTSAFVPSGSYQIGNDFKIVPILVNQEPGTILIKGDRAANKSGIMIEDANATKFGLVGGSGSMTLVAGNNNHMVLKRAYSNDMFSHTSLYGTGNVEHIRLDSAIELKVDTTINGSLNMDGDIIPDLFIGGESQHSCGTADNSWMNVHTQTLTLKGNESLQLKAGANGELEVNSVPSDAITIQYTTLNYNTYADGYPGNRQVLAMKTASIITNPHAAYYGAPAPGPGWEIYPTIQMERGRTYHFKTSSNNPWLGFVVGNPTHLFNDPNTKGTSAPCTLYSDVIVENSWSSVENNDTIKNILVKIPLNGPQTIYILQLNGGNSSSHGLNDMDVGHNSIVEDSLPGGWYACMQAPGYGDPRYIENRAPSHWMEWGTPGEMRYGQGGIYHCIYSQWADDNGQINNHEDFQKEYAYRQETAPYDASNYPQNDPGELGHTIDFVKQARRPRWLKIQTDMFTN